MKKQVNYVTVQYSDKNVFSASVHFKAHFLAIHIFFIHTEAAGFHFLTFALPGHIVERHGDK